MFGRHRMLLSRAAIFSFDWKANAIGQSSRRRPRQTNRRHFEYSQSQANKTDKHTDRQTNEEPSQLGLSSESRRTGGRDGGKANRQVHALVARLCHRTSWTEMFAGEFGRHNSLVCIEFASPLVVCWFQALVLCGRPSLSAPLFSSTVRWRQFNFTIATKMHCQVRTSSSLSLVVVVAFPPPAGPPPARRW